MDIVTGCSIAFLKFTLPLAQAGWAGVVLLRSRRKADNGVGSYFDYLMNRAM